MLTFVLGLGDFFAYEYSIVYFSLRIVSVFPWIQFIIFCQNSIGYICFGLLVLFLIQYLCLYIFIF
jgi:hypothetical protein